MEPALIGSLIAGVLAAAGHVGSRAAGKPQNRNRQGRKAQSGGPSGMYPTSRADLAVRVPTSRGVPRTVPRNIANKIAWDTVKSVQTITAATTGSPTETNYATALNAHPQYTSWTALFDQYCIPQFSVTIESQMPPGSTSLPITLYTALDFDSANALGSIQAIEDFSTCEEKVMGHQAKVVRSVRPTTKEAVAGSGGTRLGALEQNWVDCALPDVLHYGIRTLLSQEAALTVKMTLTVWFAFRNQI